MGRLTKRPFFLLGSVAQQAEAYLAIDMPEERAAIELLGRKRSLFYSSRARLYETLRGLISAAAADITMYGDEVAETIEPGSTEESVQAQHENAQKRVEERCSQLEQGAKSAIEKELQGLDRQLEELYNGVLAQELRGQVLNTSVHSGDDFGKMDGPKVERTGSGSTGSANWPVRLQKVGKHRQESRGLCRQLDLRSFCPSRAVWLCNCCTRKPRPPSHLQRREVSWSKVQALGCGERGATHGKRSTSHQRCWGCLERHCADPRGKATGEA